MRETTRGIGFIIDSLLDNYWPRGFVSPPIICITYISADPREKRREQKGREKGTDDGDDKYYNDDN